MLSSTEIRVINRVRDFFALPFIAAVGGQGLLAMTMALGGPKSMRAMLGLADDSLWIAATGSSQVVGEPWTSSLSTAFGLGSISFAPIDPCWIRNFIAAELWSNGKRCFDVHCAYWSEADQPRHGGERVCSGNLRRGGLRACRSRATSACSHERVVCTIHVDALAVRVQHVAKSSRRSHRSDSRQTAARARRRPPASPLPSEARPTAPSWLHSQRDRTPHERTDRLEHSPDVLASPRARLEVQEALLLGPAFRRLCREVSCRTAVL